MRREFIGACLGAASSAACAQSSVTMFGVVDSAITHTQGSGPHSSSKWQLADGGWRASRLGFRGTEDLGGGLAANFWIEMGFRADDGGGIPTTTNNQLNGIAGGGALNFNRRSTVSLSGPFGEVRLGRDYTPTFLNIPIFDAVGTGSGIGSTPLYVYAINGGGFPTAVRASNSIGYLLPPKLGGFYGHAMLALGENDSRSVLPRTTIPNRRDGNYAGTRLGYENGVLDIAWAYGRTSFVTGDARIQNVGARYTFGDSLMGLKLLGTYNQEARGALRGQGAMIGFQLPIGAGELQSSYTRFRRQVPGVHLEPTSGVLALAYVYNFSKRTAAYATVARLSNRNGAANTLNWTVLTAPDHPSTGQQVGLRHNF
jgi:predicted porin